MGAIGRSGIHNVCLLTGTAKGATSSNADFVNAPSTVHFYVRAAEGHMDKGMFLISKSGPWHKLF